MKAGCSGFDTRDRMTLTYCYKSITSELLQLTVCYRVIKNLCESALGIKTSFRYNTGDKILSQTVLRTTKYVDYYKISNHNFVEELF